MSRFFIDRPIFAWVIAIIVMLAGLLSIVTLPVAQYPAIAPPAVSITATYPGASADTLQNTVTRVIEEQMKGIDHLEYISSTADSSGAATITLTFAQGTDPDIAQVQTQNKLSLAQPLLPSVVQQQGVVVAKATKNFLMALAVYSDDNSHTSSDLGDIIVSQLQDPLSRVNGVGDTQLFGAQYAMRIWLDPYKLQTYGLTTSDISSVVASQNAQVSAGQIGAAPAPAGQELNAIILGQSRLQTPEQFKNIIVKTNTDGSLIRLSDVARVELGQDSYNTESRYNRHNAAGFGIKLAPGANALQTDEAVRKRVAELSSGFPPDVKYAFPYDTTPFVKLSIEDVVKTLFEAIALVFVVMFLFLQNWRATIIPTIAVPVVLLGTFAVLKIVGFTINTLTLFAMVLAIGLLVDDAIVVVENVERIIEEEGLPPKEAAKKSMDEITGALVGIALVLVAVFIPMAFFGGSVGVIYRQFSITIVSAVLLSVFIALTLTPSLCATLLKPKKKARRGGHASGGLLGGFFNWFNKTFDKGVHAYEGGLKAMIKGWVPSAIVYLVIVGILGFMFLRLPTGFLPDEDQGVMFNLVQLPPNSTFNRTETVMRGLEDHFLDDEKANVKAIFTIAGFSFAGAGENAGIAFVLLNDWSDRKGAANHAPAIAQRAMAAWQGFSDAQVFTVVPPAVQELGNATGFDLELKDVGNVGHDALVAAQGKLLGMAAQDHTLVGVRPNSLPDVPQLQFSIDGPRATALGLNISDINNTLSTAFGSGYIDQFIDRDRVKRIYAQAEPQYRASPDDLQRWYVRGASGSLAPFSAFSSVKWTYGPSQLQRYNGEPALEIQGQPAPGVSSGAALDTMQKYVGKLGKGIGYEWTGLSYEEKASGSQTSLLYALSILVVFLCLAALYESWSVPIAVLLVIPLGIVGAVLAASFRGLSNDVYFQVGILTTMGLAAKNAILIVEFAENAERTEGKNPVEAALEAARLRLRPILMTSLAFIVGVFPLAISTGAGSGSQNDIGTGVIGGMLSATILAIFFVPLAFVLVGRLFGDKAAKKKSDKTPSDEINETNSGEEAPA
ncbi:MAG: efflux RND transporter permease subunit [Caulobacteraceae bacterium]|nr:efflux RND transporter permease subunit [Caulobacter sp.]